MRYLKNKYLYLSIVSLLLLSSCSKIQKGDEKTEEYPDEEKYEIVYENFMVGANKNYYVVKDKESEALYIFTSDGKYSPMVNSNGSIKIYNENED